MKTIATFLESVAARLLPALAAGCLAACDETTTLRRDEPPGETLRSILHLKSLCPADGSVAIAQEITIRGTVTANDHYGEFDREIVVEDRSGAIRIAIDHAPLSDLFPFGCIVTVQCNGLALGTYGGRVVLGAEPDARYGATRIPASEIERRIRCEGQGETLQPQQPAFDAVTAEQIDTYVRFDGVRFAETGTWCDFDPATQRSVTTEREIVDAAGRRFCVRTLGTCVYAAEPVPSGTGSLYGNVDCFDGRYSLRVTAYRALFPTAAAPPTAYPSTAEY